MMTTTNVHRTFDGEKPLPMALEQGAFSPENSNAVTIVFVSGHGKHKVTAFGLPHDTAKALHLFAGATEDEHRKIIELLEGEG